MEIFIRRGVVANDEKDNIIKTKNGITCGCSYPDIELREHCNKEHCVTDIYSCRSCGNTIRIAFKKEGSPVHFFEP